MTRHKKELMECARMLKLGNLTEHLEELLHQAQEKQLTYPEFLLACLREEIRNRKDLYRRQRDLSIFAFIGVYLLSVIDAYVDAELSDFDISKDLGLKIEPVIFNDGRNKIGGNAIGLQCSLKF